MIANMKKLPESQFNSEVKFPHLFFSLNAF